MRRSSFAACVAAGLALAAGEGAAQPAEGVSLSPRFVAGRVDRYEISAEFEAGAGGGEPTAVHQDAVIRVTTVGVDQAGAATVRIAFERFSQTMVEPGRDGAAESVVTSWDWSEAAPAGQEPAAEEPADEPAGAEAPELLRPCGALVLSILEVKVKTDGAVSEIDGLDEALQLLSPDDRVPVLGFFMPPGIAHNLGALWSVDPEGGARKIDDRWTVVRPIPVSDTARVAMTTEWTLEEIEGDVAKAAGEVEFEVRPPRGAPNPVDPVVRLGERSGREAVSWDTGAGALVERSWDRSLEWTFVVHGDPPIESDATSRASVRITRLPPAP